jgi:peptidoglycan hydrolase CwlO-like protein
LSQQEEQKSIIADLQKKRDKLKEENKALMEQAHRRVPKNVVVP